MENSLIPKIMDALKSEQLYNKLGLGVIRIIQRRTRKGVDMHGDFFEDYSEGYAKRKLALGFVDNTTVNLTLSKVNGMLSKIDHRVAGDLLSASVLIDDPIKERIARYHNIEGAGKGRVIREFWGIELQSEKDELSNIGFKEIQKILRQL